jgi:selenocysteine-specific elongation factor
VHVVATAGHVDHGKSTLVRALTGTEPDRLAEERRRGLSIQLGYAWTSLPGAGDVAFVDVPGHERFLATMLSGIGPVPAVLLVVAADDPWMPQAAEHLAALDALGVRHAVVAVSRSDLADPAPMAARAREEVDRTTLAGAPVLPVSGATGLGLDDLRDALAAMVGRLPAPDPAADVRLWVDRLFTIRGAGTVVTGTLPAGTVRVGDRLVTATGSVRVRTVQALGAAADEVCGVARVALNVVPDDRADLERSPVLVSPGAWHFTDSLDVRLRPAGDASGEPPERPVLHVGATDLSVRVRPLGGDDVRLTLPRPLPLRIGDRAILRDPGSRRMWGLTVLDPAPPRLRRRGAAARRAAELARSTGVPDVDVEVERRGIASADLLRKIGVGTEADGWLVSDRAAELVRRRMREVVTAHDAQNSLDPGIPVAALARTLALPSPDLVADLVAEPLRLVDGRVTATAARAGLPGPLEESLARLAEDLAEAPFAAPTADRLSELGLDRRSVGAAAKAGRLLDLGAGIVLLPDADRLAAQWLAELPQPFTTSEARQRLGTSRRVALPLLAHLDRVGRTLRHPDDRRSVR